MRGRTGRLLTGHCAILLDDGAVAGESGGTRLPRSAGQVGEVSFRILDRAGDPVTEYVEEQTKLLHLYVVRGDYGVFRHLHPTLGEDGRWRVVAEAFGYPAGMPRQMALPLPPRRVARLLRVFPQVS